MKMGPPVGTCVPKGGLLYVEFSVFELSLENACLAIHFFITHQMQNEYLKQNEIKFTKFHVPTENPHQL